ncbi:UbiA family prenyltransferase [archaeon]|nr:UbiA family prenyltransferase [archaeon]
MAVEFKRRYVAEFLKTKIALLKELIIFTRPETGLFLSGMAVSGYLLFNGPAAVMVFLFLTAFFTTASAYSYNYLTDKKEDLVNNKKLNLFVVNGKGILAVAGFTLMSFIFASFLPGPAFILYIVWVTSGIYYSKYGVKKVFLVKNIYTGVAMSLAFLIGALAGGQFTGSMLYYVPIIALVGFSINVLGDLRGYDGDKHVGIRTIPVLFGFDAGKKVLCASLCIILLSIVGLQYRGLYPLVLPLLLALAFLVKNDLKKTRYSILSSQMILAIALFISGFIS